MRYPNPRKNKRRKAWDFPCFVAKCARCLASAEKYQPKTFCRQRESEGKLVSSHKQGIFFCWNQYLSKFLTTTKNDFYTKYQSHFMSREPSKHRTEGVSQFRTIPKSTTQEEDLRSAQSHAKNVCWENAVAMHEAFSSQRRHVPVPKHVLYQKPRIETNEEHRGRLVGRPISSPGNIPTHSKFPRLPVSAAFRPEDDKMHVNCWMTRKPHVSQPKKNRGHIQVENLCYKGHLFHSQTTKKNDFTTPIWKPRIKTK